MAASTKKAILAGAIVLAAASAGAQQGWTPPAWGNAPAAPSAAQAQLTGAQGELEQAQERLEAARNQAQEAAVQIDQLEESHAGAQAAIAGRARALYRLRRAGMLPLAGGFQAMLQHLSRVGRLERMLKGDLDSVRFYTQRGSALRAAKAEAEESVRDVEAEVSRAEQAVATAQQAVETERMYGGLFAAPAPRLPVTNGAGAPSWDAAISAQRTRRFADQRGNLAMPTAAPAQLQQAQRDDGVGLEFVIGGPASIRAVADGRVAFSRRYGRYGLMVVLDHGDSYYSVYAGLERSEATIGDWVARGGRLGMVRDQPLYFEVRRGTRSLDARSWLGAP